MKRLATCLLACMTVIAAAAADPLEGRWKINGDGAMVDIVTAAGRDGCLLMLAVDCPDMSVIPGTELAVITPGAEAGIYDCRARSDLRRQGAAGGRSHSFKLVLNGDDFTFEPYRRSVSISLWRWIPYLFRVTVVNRSERPAGLDGARRVDAPQRFLVI